MNEKHINAATARKIELIIRKINSLSTIPNSLAKILPLLKTTNLQNSHLTEIIESDPPLSANILALANSQSKNSPVQNIASAIDSLPQKLLRQAIMTTKTNQTSSQNKNLHQLIKFCIAAACASDQIGKIILPPNKRKIAYSAGLLHCIGKFAIQQALPKSYEKIDEEARLLGESDINIEQKYLSIDHNIIGKRLADKWKLPNDIAMAIWLSTSDIQAILTAVPQNHPAIAVALARLIAIDAQIGSPGTYQIQTSPNDFANSLNISQQQISDIKKSLPQLVQQRIELLGLDIEEPEKIYSHAVWELAANLANDNSQLSQQNIQLTANIGISDFANNFLPMIPHNASPLEIISTFANRWQQYYQTGPVCIYLCRPHQDDLVDAVIIDQNSQTNIELLSLPGSSTLIPQKINGSFQIIDADNDTFDWIYKQLDTNINPNRSKAIPIISSGKTLAVVIWQYNYLPSDPDQLASLAGPANIAGPVIELSYAYENQQRIAEEFASLLGRLGNIKEKISKTENLHGLAEMAAGAAHELNNPITVVSGRLQLLMEQEKNKQKSESLKLIKQRVEEISNIVSDLMQFADPTPPSIRTVSPAVLIDSSIDYLRQNFDITDIETSVENLETLRDISVDSDQIKTALANIIANAYQSYHNTGKLVKISGAEQNQSFVRIQISDNGCGMDPQTLQKARQPFFSGQPAGRKRGMGLSHAQRLISINKGSLHISSQPGKGTTATVLLPTDQSQ